MEEEGVSAGSTGWNGLRPLACRLYGALCIGFGFVSVCLGDGRMAVT
jgi:hypothetical protein